MLVSGTSFGSVVVVVVCWRRKKRRTIPLLLDNTTIGGKLDIIRMPVFRRKGREEPLFGLPLLFICS